MKHVVKLFLVLLCLVGAANAQDLKIDLARVKTRLDSVKQLVRQSEAMFAKFRNTSEFNEKFVQFDRGTFGSPFSYQDSKVAFGEAEVYYDRASALFSLEDSTEYSEIAHLIKRSNELLGSAIQLGKRPTQYVVELRAVMANGRAMLDTMSAQLDTIGTRIVWFQRTLLVGPDSALYKSGRHGVGREARLLGMQKQAETYYRLAESALNAGDYAEFLKRRKEFDAVYTKFTGQSIFFNRNLAKEHK